jgi:hypothetical protein
MGQAKRRGSFDERKLESEFYADERRRLDQWLSDHRPIVVDVDTHGNVRRRKTSSLQRALLIAALCRAGSFVMQDGVRITNNNAGVLRGEYEC